MRVFFFKKIDLSCIFFDQGSLQMCPVPELPNLAASGPEQAESTTCTSTALGGEYPDGKSWG